MPVLRLTQLSNTLSFVCPAKNMHSVHEPFNLHFLSGRILFAFQNFTWMYPVLPHALVAPSSSSPLPKPKAPGSYLSQNATVLAVLCPQISLLSYLPSSGSSSVPGFQSTKGSWLGDVCWGLVGGILDRAHTIHESLKTTWRRLLLSHSSGSIASTRFSKRLEVLER